MLVPPAASATINGQAGSAAAGDAASSNASSATSNGTSWSQTLLSELNTYAKETPMQHLEDSVLGQLGTTRQQLEAMPPAQQEQTMLQVREMMQRDLQVQQQQKLIQQALQVAAGASGSSGSPVKIPYAHAQTHSTMRSQAAVNDKGAAIDVAI